MRTRWRENVRKRCVGSFRIRCLRFSVFLVVLHVRIAVGADGSVNDAAAGAILTKPKCDSYSHHRNFLERIYPMLEKHYDWLRATHIDQKTDAFRWTGRLVNHTFTSGLDDYPRSPEPNESERHLDLFCWLMMATRVLHRVGSRLGKDTRKYVELYSTMFHRLHGECTFCILDVLEPVFLKLVLLCLRRVTS